MNSRIVNLLLAAFFAFGILTIVTSTKGFTPSLSLTNIIGSWDETSPATPYDYMTFNEYCYSVGKAGTVLGFSTTDTEAKEILCVIPTQGLVETDILRDGRVKSTRPITGGGTTYDRVVTLATNKVVWQPLGKARVDDLITRLCTDGSELLAIDNIRTVAETEQGDGTVIEYGNPYCFKSSTKSLVNYDGSTGKMIRVWLNFTPIR